MTIINLEQYRKKLPKVGCVQFPDMNDDRAWCVIVRNYEGDYTIINGFPTLEAAQAVLRKMLRGAR